MTRLNETACRRRQWMRVVLVSVYPAGVVWRRYRIGVLQQTDADGERGR